MPVDRPTFNESWYRISGLRPRLRFTVQVHRQHFRGQMWHVLQDPASNQFFRLSTPAYHFVALLDGRRTVAEAWNISNQELGDSAPTQGEAIQLLGQLYTSNLLQAELPPDAESLFRRYHRRVTREVQSYLTNLLFIRIPLFDPDHFLDRWVRVLGCVFTKPGLAVLVGLLCTAFYCVAGRGAELVDRASGILSVANLPLLYVGLILVKVCHEFGHAFACKKFGQQEGKGGEVHVIGVMFLIFTPLPYVDASSAWAFRQKWRRVVVGTSGMMVELGVASIAAILWASAAQGTTLYALTYNMMFIASVSTILFNGNPLLRYDGYYILSDLLEIPNLAQRSKGYIYYLVRRYLWRVRRPQSTAHSIGERPWLAFYAVASTAYRVTVCFAILLFVMNKFFLVGVILGLMALSTWVFVPLGKFAHYLATHGELDRIRVRAVGSTLLFLVVIGAGVGLIPAPDHCRVEGVVVPARLAFVHAGADGFVTDIHRLSGENVSPGISLLQAADPGLWARYGELLAQREELEARKGLADAEEEHAKVQMFSKQIAALDENIEGRARELRSLTLRAPVRGTWIAPDIENFRNRYFSHGEKVGMVASLDDLIIRATAGQNVAAALIEEIEVKKNDRVRRVELRVKGRPDSELKGRIRKILPAGDDELPSAALGYAAGGSVQTAPTDRKGTRTTERFFEIRIVPETSTGLLCGQRVVVRAALPTKPLALQWWRGLLRLFQRRSPT